MSKKNTNTRNVKLTAIIATILAVLLVASVIISCGTLYWGWFKKGSTAVDTTSAADETNNLVVNDADSSGISLAMTALSGSNELGGTTYSGTVDLGSGEITYESSYAISATLNNENATTQTITWTLAWASSSDNTLSDYVVLSAETSTSGEEITIYCLQAFDTQITLTATNGDVSGTCTIDYVKRATGFECIATCDDEGTYTVTEYSTEKVVTFCGQNTKGLTAELGLYLDNYDGINFVYADDSVGSVEEYGWNEETAKLYISFTDDLKNEIETALGVSDIKLDINELYSCGGDFSNFYTNTEDVLNKILGVDDAMSQEYYKSLIYNTFISYYNSNTPVFKITLECTGYRSGVEYSFDAYAKLDPSAFYVSANSVSTSKTSIYF